MGEHKKDVKEAILGIAKKAKIHVPAAILLLLFMAWYGANTPGSMWVDEAFNLMTGRTYLRGTLFHHESHPPLGSTLISLPQLFTKNPQASRLMCAGMAVLTLGLVYYFLAKHTKWYLALGGMALLGSSKFFSQFAIQAMLEVPLTLLLMLSFVVMMHIMREEKTILGSRESIILGICFGAALATKYTSIPFLATFFIIYLLPKHVRSASRRERAVPLVIAAILMFLLAWLPYWQIVPDKVQAHLEETSSDDMLLSKTPWWLMKYHTAFQEMLPSLPGIVTASYTSLGKYVSEFTYGRPIYIKETTYPHAPWWTYIQWWGWTLGIAAAVLVAIVLGGTFISTKGDVLSPGCMLLIIGIPFIFLSLLPLKSYFYTLPLMPLIVIAGILTLHRLPLPLWAPPAIIGVLLIMPGGGVWQAGADISLDTGYEEAARFVEGFYLEHPDTGVLAFHWQTIAIYVEPHMYTRMNIYKGLPYRDEPINKCPYIENGSYGIFIDFENQERFEHTETYQCSRNLAKETVYFGEGIGQGLIGLIYIE